MNNGDGWVEVAKKSKKTKPEPRQKLSTPKIPPGFSGKPQIKDQKYKNGNHLHGDQRRKRLVTEEGFWKNPGNEATQSTWWRNKPETRNSKGSSNEQNKFRTQRYGIGHRGDNENISMTENFDGNYNGEILNAKFPGKFISFPIDQIMKSNSQGVGLNEIFSSNGNDSCKKFYTKRDVYNNTIRVDINGKTRMLNGNKPVPQLFPIKKQQKNKKIKKIKKNKFEVKKPKFLKRPLSEKEIFGQNPVLQNMMKLTFGEQNIRTTSTSSSSENKKKSPIAKLNETSIPKLDFSIEKENSFSSPYLNKKNPFLSQEKRIVQVKHRHHRDDASLKTYPREKKYLQYPPELEYKNYSLNPQKQISINSDQSDHFPIPPLPSIIEEEEGFFYPPPPPIHHQDYGTTRDDLERELKKKLEYERELLEQKLKYEREILEQQFYINEDPRRMSRSRSRRDDGNHGHKKQYHQPEYIADFLEKKEAFHTIASRTNRRREDRNHHHKKQYRQPEYIDYPTSLDSYPHPPFPPPQENPVIEPLPQPEYIDYPTSLDSYSHRPFPPPQENPVLEPLPHPKLYRQFPPLEYTEYHPHHEEQIQYQEHNTHQERRRNKFPDQPKKRRRGRRRRG